MRIYDLTKGKKYGTKLHFNNTRFVDTGMGARKVQDLSVWIKDIESGQAFSEDFNSSCRIEDGPYQIFDHQLKVEPFVSRVLLAH